MKFMTLCAIVGIFAILSGAAKADIFRGKMCVGSACFGASKTQLTIGGNGSP